MHTYVVEGATRRGCFDRNDAVGGVSLRLWYDADWRIDMANTRLVTRFRFLCQAQRPCAHSMDITSSHGDHHQPKKPPSDRQPRQLWL